MKKFLFFLLVATMFSSCKTLQTTTSTVGKQSIIETKLGDSGLRLSTGIDGNEENPKAWISLIADLNKVKAKTIERLKDWFPTLEKQIDSFNFKK